MQGKKTITALFIIALLSLPAKSQNYSCEAMYGASMLEGVNGDVHAITTYQGKIVVGGGFTSAAGVQVRNAAIWDPAANTWQALGNDLGINPGDTVMALEVYNNVLYAGGSFVTSGGATNIAQWNGTSWDAVGPGANGEVYALKVYNSTLVAGGQFDNIGSRIAAWNGSVWSQIGNGFITSGGSRVFALTIFNSNLVAAGRLEFSGSTPIHNIALWNGSVWSDMSSSTDERIHALAVHNGQLFAGGRFTSIGGANAQYIAMYNSGLSWSALPGGNLDDRVLAIASYDAYGLIAGGHFKYAGSQYVNYIARWDGTNWHRMITGGDENIKVLTKIDSSIYVGGEFEILAGIRAHHVARWFNRSTAIVSGTARYADNNQLVDSGRVFAVRRDYFTNEVIVVDSGRIVNGLYQLINPPTRDTLRVILLPDDELDFVPTYYPSTIDWRSAVTVVPGQNTSNIDVNVYRVNQAPASPTAAVIRGTIHLNIVIPLDPPGSYPYRSGSILYVKQGSQFKRFSTSGTNENYVTSPLEAGTYELVAYRLGYCLASASITIGASTTDTIVNFSLDTCSPIGIHNITNRVPENFMLAQNYPNPFNPVTTIGFSLPENSNVQLSVFDILGREVEVLVNEILSAGEYKYVFDAGRLSSGIYFYKLETSGIGNFEKATETKKMVLIK